MLARAASGNRPAGQYDANAVGHYARPDICQRHANEQEIRLYFAASGSARQPEMTA
jgi:hypothetical protein